MAERKHMFQRVCVCVLYVLNLKHIIKRQRKKQFYIQIIIKVNIVYIIKMSIYITALSQYALEYVE